MFLVKTGTSQTRRSGHPGFVGVKSNQIVFIFLSVWKGLSGLHGNVISCSGFPLDEIPAECRGPRLKHWVEATAEASFPASPTLIPTDRAASPAMARVTEPLFTGPDI